MLNREIPFLRIIIPLCAGILTCLYLKPGNLFLVITATLIFTGFVIGLFQDQKQPGILFGLNITVSLFICGILLYKTEKEGLTDLPGEPLVYIGTLTGYPEEKTNSFKIILKLNYLESEKGSERVKGSVIIYFRKDLQPTSLIPGDILKIILTPKPVTNRGNPFEFDYRFYLENRGIKYSAFAGNENILAHLRPPRISLKYRALIIRERIIEMYRERGITGERLALVSAMTLGQKNMLDPEQKEIFVKAGVMHIMAVSGLHAMVISLFISKLLFFLIGKLKPYRVIITIVLLWSFAFITGLTPSVLRASIMFSFLETGKLIRRNVNNINSVLASAFIMILFKPSVIFDAGFLLSYSAVIFIICFYRDLYFSISFKKYIPDKIWQSAVVTVIAQAGTLPLTIALFNRFPVWFILSNIIIVPLSSFLIITCCIIPLTYPLKFISLPLGYLLSQLAGVTETLTATISGLPFSSIANIGLNKIEAFLLFASIITAFFWLTNRKSLRASIPAFIILLFVTTVTVRDLTLKRTGELIVYNSQSSLAIGIRSGKKLVVYSYGGALSPEVIRHCSMARLKARQVLLKKNINLIKAGECSILVTHRVDRNIISSNHPDYLVLTGKAPGMGSSVNEIGNISLIIAPDVPESFRAAEDPENKLSVYTMKKNGAFRVRLY